MPEFLLIVKTMYNQHMETIARSPRVSAGKSVKHANGIFTLKNGEEKKISVTALDGDTLDIFIKCQQELGQRPHLKSEKVSESGLRIILVNLPSDAGGLREPIEFASSDEASMFLSLNSPGITDEGEQILHYEIFEKQHGL